MKNNAEREQHTCPVCHATTVDIFLELSRLPVECNVLLPTREAALAVVRGDMQLGLCYNCSHIFNFAFDPTLMDYSETYENSLHFSPRFQSYAESLADRLIERYDLYGKDIVEIGSGSGDFLKLLCKRGSNRGTGFDPSFTPERAQPETTEKVRFVQEYYTAEQATDDVALVCCRHVLEHIHAPREFLATVRRSIGNSYDTVVFFEVPNALFTLKDLAIWDLIYEHCSYFTDISLSALFRLSGFDVIDLAERYEGQFLSIEAVLGTRTHTQVRNDGVARADLAALTAAFAERYRRKVDHWQQMLVQMAAAGQRAVVWGAGSKGITFLNALDTRGGIEHIVDINPHKHGMYVAGSGQRIVAPEFLTTYEPDVVIVMNAIYTREIRRQLRRLDLSSVDVIEA